MRALVIDFETTGLPFHPHAKQELHPRAIEFAGVLMNEVGEVSAEDSWLIKPPGEISEVITKITGITNTDLAAAEPFVVHLSRLRELFDQADALVAHNLPFDAGILAHELALIGELAAWRWPPHLICTVQTYEPLWGRRPKLIELYEAVTNNKYVQTHRALDDVRALVDIVAQERLLHALAPVARPDRVQLPVYFCPHTPPVPAPC